MLQLRSIYFEEGGEVIEESEMKMKLCVFYWMRFVGHLIRLWSENDSIYSEYMDVSVYNFSFLICW